MMNQTYGSHPSLVMRGLVQRIHVFLPFLDQRHGWPEQVRP
jgi:hypothetical protein